MNAGGPVEASGAVKSHYSSGAERWAAFKRAGAIGIATIPGGRGPNGAAPGNDAVSGGRGDGATEGRGNGGRGPQTSVALADPALQETAGERVVVTVGRPGAEVLFEGSGHTFEEIEKLANANQPLPTFPLQGLLKSKTVVHRSEMQASNVAVKTLCWGPCEFSRPDKVFPRPD